ncbi:ABC transporter ATP-binding protein [Streptococcus gordonii]|uniref:ABC transporter ATP-binding protein n=1 Tax=Streptococcus gordonii TaxID=1302 RepID=UPI001CC0A1DA|nr:ABC transporter ATP-binding protein [Streptococcus gordonii]MBZ2124414.1 ABC transporter ATP-binding protein [Streptococcus gordonii]WAM20890.1 ABC transporter ATP-binding protein [Streptococcus gordonii]
MLKIEHLTKVYSNGKKAVDDLSLMVESGDIYGFIGANGAGKTSTIKSIVGIHDFDKGEIYICGHSIRKEPLLCKKKMAFLPDNPDLYKNLTARQFLDFVADIYRVSMEKRRAAMEKYSKMFELDTSLDQLISAYSHGMKQRLALIAALLHEPELLILDEPFVGLDPKGAYYFKQIMRELASQGHAIFFSTHVLEVAEELCNKVAILQKGRLVANGRTPEVKGAFSLEQVFMELQDDD